MKKILFAGVGSLGSQIAMHLAGPQHKMTFIDDDVVEAQNIGTSAYGYHHLGLPKVRVIAQMVESRGAAETLARQITAKHEKDFPKADLVIDTFDNPRARRLTTKIKGTVLHVGVSPDRTGMVYWDDVYHKPKIVFERGHNPICTNALGRPILRVTAAVASGIIEHYLRTGKKRSVLVMEDGRIVE